MHSVSFLFDLILYIPVNNFQLCQDGSSLVEPVLSKDAQGHNTVTPLRSNMQPLGLESSTLPLSHGAP